MCPLTAPDSTKRCLQCDSPLGSLPPSHAKTRKFCSRPCAARWRIESGGFAPQKTRVLRNCVACGQEYAARSGRQRFCKECVHDKAASHRVRRYGITATQLAEMYEAQDGRCALCRRSDPQCVDHDHQTGRVRGYLCRTCNMALHYIENEEWLARARRYLRGGD